jgi:hypothetical protein
MGALDVNISGTFIRTHGIEHVKQCIPDMADLHAAKIELATIDSRHPDYQLLKRGISIMEREFNGKKSIDCLTTDEWGGLNDYFWADNFPQVKLIEKYENRVNDIIDCKRVRINQLKIAHNY